MGAVASVVLALLFLQRYQSGGENETTSPKNPVATARVSTRNPNVISLAVLPLTNLSGDPQQEYFADGMTEALITDLAQLQGLRVISRSSSMQYKGGGKSIPQVASELDVDLIVEGSVIKAADSVRVTAQLIDAARDEHIWAHSYDRKLNDVLALQSEVATTIAREVKGALTPEQQSRLGQRRATSPAVYDLYLRGRHAWNLRTAEGFRTAISYFSEAIKEDPAFALAYAGLADTYSLIGGPAFGEVQPAANAKAMAQRAIELDDTLAEAHASLAAVLHRNEGAIAAADREFKRAVELNPGYATGHQWYAILLAEEGRDDEATRHAQQAVALDPLSGPIHQTLGLAHYYGRRFSAAASAARRSLELTPHLPLARVILARSLIAQGAFNEAITVCGQASSPPTPEIAGTMALAQFRAGDRARAQASIDALRAQKPAPVTALARWYALTGDADTALRLLEEAAGQGMRLQSIKNDPDFDRLRANARFTALLQRF